MADRFACAICLSFESEVTADYFVCTKCGHIFHYSCIKSAVDNHAYRKCPVCRKAMSISSLTRLYGIESPAKQVEIPCSSSLNVLCCDGGKSGVDTILLELNRNSQGAEFHTVDNPNAPNDCIFHIAVVGSSAVGKTSILQKFVNDTYSDAPRVTVGVDCSEKVIRVRDVNIKLCLWDVGLSDCRRFPTYGANYLRNKQAIIMAYSIADMETYTTMESWNEITKEYGPDDAFRVIIGNKCDQEDRREVPTCEAEEMAKRMGVPFFETSAKEGQNIEILFQSIIGKIIKSLETSSSAKENKGATPLGRRRSSQASSRFGSDRRCSII